MDLNRIYEALHEDLAKVDAELAKVSNVNITWLRDMLDSSLKGSGKRVRPILTLMAGKFYNYNMGTLLPMATSVELMHTATLVHDDAIDKSMERRSRPTIFKLYGTEQAVLLGDYLFAKAGDCVADTQSVRAIKIFCQTLMIISSGEIDQARNSFNLNQTREQYFNRIFSKTASLFSLSTESGAILSNAPETAVQALKDYGRNLGIAFQIIDDILDFVGTEKEVGKPIGADLAQGTFTLPAMLLVEKYPKDNPVIKIFHDPHDNNLRANIILAQKMISESPIVDECYKLAKEYCFKACENLKTLPDCSTRDLLTELADFVVKRNK